VCRYCPSGSLFQRSLPYSIAYARWFLYRGNRLSPLQIRVLALVIRAIVLEGVDIQVIGLAAPLIIREWAITRAALGPAMAASLIGNGDWGRRWAVMRPLWASTGADIQRDGVRSDDIAGRSRPQRRAIGLACGFAAGIGFGAVLSTAPPLIAESLPQRLRGSAWH